MPSRRTVRLHRVLARSLARSLVSAAGSSDTASACAYACFPLPLSIGSIETMLAYPSMPSSDTVV